MRRFYAAIIALCSAANALQPASPITARHRVVCHGKKTNALLGALRRVPLVKRVVPKKERAPRTPPPPETSVEAAPEIAELIDAEADEAAKVLEAVAVGDLTLRNRGALDLTTSQIERSA